MNGMAYVRGEVTLWRAVVHVALLDAIGLGPSASSSAERKRVRDEARSWFRRAGRDFHTVCDLALLDAALVRAFALQLIETDGTVLERMPARRRRMEWRSALASEARHA
jgi:hypothetical protein